MRTPGMRPSVMAVVLMLGLTAGAEPVQGPGIRFEAPPGWIAVTPDRREMMEHAPAGIRSVLARIDLGQVAAFVIDPTEDEFHESVNVVTAPGTMPITEYSRSELAQELPRALASGQMTVNSLKVEILQLGRNRVISAMSEVIVAGSPVELRQWQVYVPSRDRTFTITCTALKQDFAAREPIFRSLLESVAVEPPAAAGGILSGAARGALVGGAAGGLAALVWALIRRARKQPRGEAPPA